MVEKSTELLNQILKSTSNTKDFKKYISKENLNAYSGLSEYFNEYIGLHQLKVPDIIQKSGLSKDYAYPILNGRKKNPSRDRIIALCIGAGMSLAELKRALEISNAGILYPREPRDAAIIFCLNNGKNTVIDINLFLDELGLSPLQTEKEKSEQ